MIQLVMQLYPVQLISAEVLYHGIIKPSGIIPLLYRLNHNHVALAGPDFE
jgi:hypothetical protein